MSDDDTMEIKTILVGMSGTGKTNIINAITGQKFEEGKMTTDTSSFVDKYMTVKNKKYRLEIWDTAGQEKFRSLTKIFIKDSKIVIFVYDITTRESFEEINFWVNTVKDILKEDKIVFGLAGNKKDLFQEEVVEEEEGEKKAQEIGALFKLTSAKTGQGINEFIQSLLEEYVKKIGDLPDDNNNRGNKLNGNNNNGKKSKCCK